MLIPHNVGESKLSALKPQKLSELEKIWSFSHTCLIFKNKIIRLTFSNFEQTKAIVGCCVKVVIVVYIKYLVIVKNWKNEAR